MRETDVRKLSFPLQITVYIMVMVASVTGGFWASQYGIRSDIRDVITRLEMREKLEEVEKRLQDERSQALTNAIRETRAKQELLQIEVQSLKEMVARLQQKQ